MPVFVFPEHSAHAVDFVLAAKLPSGEEAEYRYLGDVINNKRTSACRNIAADRMLGWASGGRGYPARHRKLVHGVVNWRSGFKYMTVGDHPCVPLHHK